MAMKRMNNTALFIAILCYAHLASGAIHSHQYIYTATSGIPGFPEFSVVGSVDGQQTNYFDSEIKKVIPRQEWVPSAVDADFWKRNGDLFCGAHPVFVSNIAIAKERFNQTGGVHTVQWMYGCQWDDETQAVDAFDQYGYDGEDFIVLDLKNLRYIATTPQTRITMNKWNSQAGQLAGQKQYYTQICIDWLKKYVEYGSSALGKKVVPKASLLRKGPKVACHATGFYPEAVKITWKKDGVEMDDDVDMGETLPNEDGTFQKRAVLTISPEERQKAQYSCEVTHKSGAPIVMVFEEAPDYIPIVISCLCVAVVALLGGIVAYFVFKKKGYSKASQTDSPDNSTGIPKA